ncbi:MAG: 30S ribosomal protein S4 [Candidatus Hodgkinia cicadicola]
MSKRDIPRCKIERRFGESLWNLRNNRLEIAPGQHGEKPRKIMSDYCIRLLSKQKLKHYYCNLTEGKFLRTYKKAFTFQGNVGSNLIRLLESRLDVLVHRANLAPSFKAARQMINHGHILLNNRKVNICSHECKPGDVFRVNPKFIKALVIKETILMSNGNLPDYIKANYKYLTFSLSRTPHSHEFKWKTSMCPSLVAEYYSRVH